MIITEQIFTIDSTISRIFSTLIRGLDRDEGRVVELEEEEENKNSTTCQYRRETAPVRFCPMAAAAAASEGRKRVMTLSGPPLLHLAHPKLFDTVFGSIRTPEACEASRITVRRRILILQPSAQYSVQARPRMAAA
jgi:hypothetical protein